VTTAAADADEGQDRDEVAGDGVGARQLREGVGNARLLDAAQVRGNKEGFLQHGLDATICAVLGMLILDLEADIVKLARHTGVVGGQTAKGGEALDGFGLAASQHEPARGLVHPEAGHEYKHAEDNGGEEDDLVLQGRGGHVEKACVDGQRADGQTGKHDDAEPDSEQAADLGRCYFNDGHGPRDGERPKTKA